MRNIRPADSRTLRAEQEASLAVVTPTDMNILDGSTDWTASHPVVAPIAWGMAAGGTAGWSNVEGSGQMLLLAVYLVVGVLAGYIVRRADVGRAGLMRSDIAFISSAILVVAPSIEAWVRQ